MLDVILTVDVEIWCEDWAKIDAQFPNAFRQYIYGPTTKGDFGLPYKLAVLQDHGLTGVFFVEPLFATRFGTEPLSEIVGLLREAKQDIQLHLHTEWVDETKVPLVECTGKKRQHLHYFSLEDQTKLIAAGSTLLNAAGARQTNAFRAGNFGFNVDTLHALAANRMCFDSSYNAAYFGLNSGFMPGTTLISPTYFSGVYEYPMTVYRDRMGQIRHASLTACSHKELEALLWQALESGHSTFVILSHCFELLDHSRTRPDPIVVERFRKLCAFLDRNRDSFRLNTFRTPEQQLPPLQPPPLISPMRQTVMRIIEQGYRRVFLCAGGATSAILNALTYSDTAHLAIFF